MSTVPLRRYAEYIDSTEAQQELRFPLDALLPQLDGHPSNLEESSSAASSPDYFAIGEHFLQFIFPCLLACLPPFVSIPWLIPKAAFMARNQKTRAKSAV